MIDEGGRGACVLYSAHLDYPAHRQGAAMESERTDIQNAFFNSARKERATVAVFLGNGKKLVGRIKSFDKFTVLLDGQFGEQIVYKNAISTVSLQNGGAHGRPPSAGARAQGNSGD